jgi:ubiquinone biosynthesis protein
MPLPDEDWGLPGTRASRRMTLYRTAARVAARYGAGKLPIPAALLKNIEPLSTWADREGALDLYRTAVHLRGGFLKLGQFASARPDLLPEPYVRELAKLQDRVPPAPTAAITRIIEADVGPVGDLFASFDGESASAASLAQVHRAVRRDDRRAVAVKVQYPRVAELVPAEMRDTRRILETVAKVVKGIGLDTIARALEASILEELDYEHEAHNIERFAANFADEPAIVVPGVHQDLSSGRVLVMDWIEGENLAIALRGVDHETAEEAARLLIDSYLKQILDDGFLHADPHPGNFLLQEGPRLGVVDFGACAALSEGSRLNLRRVYEAGLAADIPGIVAGLHDLGLRTASGDPQGLLGWATLFDFDPNVDPDAREVNFRRLVSAARTDPVAHIPAELVMLGRVLIVQAGLVSQLRPSWTIDELVAARLRGTPTTSSTD